MRCTGDDALNFLIKLQTDKRTNGQNDESTISFVRMTMNFTINGDELVYPAWASTEHVRLNRDTFIALSFVI